MPRHPSFITVTASHKSLENPEYRGLMLLSSPQSEGEGCTFWWRKPSGGGDLKNLARFLTVETAEAAVRASLETLPRWEEEWDVTLIRREPLILWEE